MSLSEPYALVTRASETPNRVSRRNTRASVHREADAQLRVARRSVMVGEPDGLGQWSDLNSSLPGRIFISYRRQETAWPAGRLYDVLVEHFPAEQVFKDVDNIDPGDEFVERMKAKMACIIFDMALIGPQWLTMTDEDGQRRLDNPEDYVRLEIETALTRKIRVIPILVDEARIPRANELPATLAPLVGRNAVEINPITFDTKRLIATVQKTLAEVKVSDTTAASAVPTSTARPDQSSQQIAQAAELTEQRPRRQTEEQARQEAKGKARREAEEHTRQQAEEQPALNRGIPSVNKIIGTIITILVVVILVIVILQLT